MSKAKGAESIQTKTKNVIDTISNLEKCTLGELFELRDTLRERYNFGDINLDGVANSGAQPVEKRWYLKLVGLGSVGKIVFLKAASSALGIDIATTKLMLEKLPYMLVDGGSKEDVEQKRSLLESVCAGLEFDAYEE